MSSYIISPTNCKSGPKLAAYLGIASFAGCDVPAGYPRPDWVIRWGSIRSIPKMPLLRRTFNSRGAITSRGDRFNQLELLSGVVPVPRFSRHPIVGAICKHCNGHGAPVAQIGRSEARNANAMLSSRGKGMTLYKAGQQPAEHDYFVEYIEKDHEYRVDVVGEATRVRELLGGDGVAWNVLGDYAIAYMGQAMHDKITAQALAAVRRFDLDFGAVDIITRDDEGFVLEVNTAPALSNYTLEWYAQQFQELMGLKQIPGWAEVEAQ